MWWLSSTHTFAIFYSFDRLIHVRKCQQSTELWTLKYEMATIRKWLTVDKWSPGLAFLRFFSKIIPDLEIMYIIVSYFSSPAQKELWWLKLSELIQVERSHSPAGASINVTYFDNATNFEHVSIFSLIRIFQQKYHSSKFHLGLAATKETAVLRSKIVISQSNLDLCSYAWQAY